MPGWLDVSSSKGQVKGVLETQIKYGIDYYGSKQAKGLDSTDLES